MPKKSGIENILEPYDYSIDGEVVTLTSLVLPLKKNGQFIGIAGIDISLKAIVEKYDQISFYNGGYISLFTQQGTILASKVKDDIRKNVSEISDNKVFIDGIKNQKNFSADFVSKKTGEKFLAVGVPFEIGKTGSTWIITAFIPKAEIFSEQNLLSF